MNETDKEAPAAGAPRPPAWTGGPLLSRLASLRFALAVVLLIALACVAGTLVPQGSQAAPFLARHPGAGRTLAVLAALGLTRVYYSWWFAGLLCAFAASLAACTVRRCALVPRASGAGLVRLAGSIATHVSLMLVLAGGLARALWGQTGTLALREGEEASSAARAGGAPLELPFSVRLVRFEVELDGDPRPPAGPGTLLVRWPEKGLEAAFPAETNVWRDVSPADAPAGAGPAFRVCALRYVPDFAIDGPSGEVTSRSAAPANPALLVAAAGGGATNTQWVFARFPGFNGAGAAGAPPLGFRFEAAPGPAAAGGAVKAFKSTLEVLEGGAAVRTATVAVNSPFAYRGYTFYQTGYDPDDPAWSSLQVVSDPGVPAVYCGFALMMAGLTAVFCVGPWLGAEGRAAKGGAA